MFPIDLLPLPTSLISEGLRLLSSVRASQRSSPGAQSSPAHFDVNIRTDTGFLPPSPLPELSEPYDIWTDALSEAQAVLKLGDNTPDTSCEEYVAGELWRKRIRAVRVFERIAMHR